MKKETADARELFGQINKMNPTAKELFKNECKNGPVMARGREYSAEIKNFSLEQAFFSNSGYEHLQSGAPGKPGLSLPSGRSLKRYVEDVNCQPGHLENILAKIQDDVKNKKHGSKATLVIGGISV